MGSGLFWVVLELGQRTAKRATNRFAQDKLAANAFALMALEGEGLPAEYSQFMCLYAALHYIVKAALIAVLSLALSSAVDVFASVGYLISTYFFFRALAFVPHTTSWGPLDARKKKYEQLLIELGESKTKSQDALSPSSEHK